jgi:hypothetical protein
MRDGMYRGTGDYSAAESAVYREYARGQQCAAMIVSGHQLSEVRNEERSRKWPHNQPFNAPTRNVT